MKYTRHARYILPVKQVEYAKYLFIRFTRRTRLVNYVEHVKQILTNTKLIRALAPLSLSVLFLYSRYNTSSPLLFSRPEKLIFLFIIYKVIKFKYNSTLRRKNFIAIIKNISIKIRSYIKYIKADKTYIINHESNSCARYLKNTKRSYNFIIF